MFNNANNRKKRIGHIIVNYPLTIKDLIQIVKEYRYRRLSCDNGRIRRAQNTSWEKKC